MHIGCPLLVVGAVGEEYRAKAACLVKAPGARIGLKALQFEGDDAARFRRLDQLRSDTLP
jgi:hypothetical protein